MTHFFKFHQIVSNYERTKIKLENSDVHIHTAFISKI